MYVSPRRVVRKGYLVAFEGEPMSDEEAAFRGLLPVHYVTPEMTVQEIKQVLDGLGIEYPKNARKADLMALLEG